MSNLEKYKDLFLFLKDNDGLISWIDLPGEFSDVMFDACVDGFVRSFGETESYQITEEGQQLLNSIEAGL